MAGLAFSLQRVSSPIIFGHNTQLQLSMQLCILSLHVAADSKLMMPPHFYCFFFFLQAASRCQEVLLIDINHYPVDSPGRAAVIDQNQIQ